MDNSNQISIPVAQSAPQKIFSHKRHKEEHRKHKSIMADGESLDVLSEITSLILLCFLCSSLCLLRLKLLLLEQFVGVFLNDTAELNNTLEVVARARQLDGVDCVWLLDDRICDKAPNLFAEFYQ